MIDIDEIRRQNMKLLEASAGSPTQAAEKCGMQLAQWANLRDGVKDSKTKKRRGMRKDTANKIAEAFDKPSGWLDIDHRANTEYPVLSTNQKIKPYRPKKTRRQLEIDEINQLLNATDDRGLAIMLDKAKEVAKQYPAVKETPESSA